jgi:hypothetical protein
VGGEGHVRDARQTTHSARQTSQAVVSSVKEGLGHERQARHVLVAVVIGHRTTGSIRHFSSRLDPGILRVQSALAGPVGVLEVRSSESDEAARLSPGEARTHPERSHLFKADAFLHGPVALVSGGW